MTSPGSRWKVLFRKWTLVVCVTCWTAFEPVIRIHSMGHLLHVCAAGGLCRLLETSFARRPAGTAGPQGWQNRIESSVAHWEPINRNNSHFTVFFPTLEPVAYGQCTFRYIDCSWRSLLK